MKRPRKKLLFAFACLLVVFLVAAFLAIEHFRGEWKLKRWKARMAAQGEVLDIDKLAPAIPRADQNGLPQLVWLAGPLSSFPTDVHPPAAAYAVPGKVIPITQLNEWPKRNPKRTNITWVAVAEQLASAEAPLQEALEVLESEAFNANINYRGGFNIPINHVTRVRALGVVLCFAALFDLHQGQREAAFAKLHGLLRLVEVLKDEPLLISQAVRMSMMNTAFNATWQALQEDGWSDAQLAQLQKAWASYDFLLPMERAIAMERAMLVAVYERFRSSDLSFNSIFNPGGGFAAGPTPSLFSWKWVAKMFDIREQVLTPLWKFTWSAQDEWHYCHLGQQILEAQRRGRPQNRGMEVVASIERIEAEAYAGAYDNLRYVLGRLMAQSGSKLLRRAWVAQTTSQIALTTVAVKRYQLRHGELPCSIEALVPEFLPRQPIDYMDGQPLRYCLDSDSNFLLYSIGPDGRDDGGQPGPANNPGFQNALDLIWAQPASEVETAVWKVRR